MKRTILITLADGRVIERDYAIYQQHLKIPIGCPLNHPQIMAMCQTICNSGIVDDQQCIDNERVVFVGPSFIKSVAVVQLDASFISM